MARAITTAYRSNDELLSFVRTFERGELPAVAWTHDAHLVVALVYARSYGPREAIERLRASIKRHNAATGTPETPTRGYHETVTLAWFHLVRHFLDVFDDGRSLAALADALPGYFAKDVLLGHYTRERLASPGARASWVDPDVRPLPELGTWARRDRAWLNALDGRTGVALGRPAAARERASSVTATPPDVRAVGNAR
jgi:hypothetical protein